MFNCSCRALEHVGVAPGQPRRSECPFLAAAVSTILRPCSSVAGQKAGRQKPSRPFEPGRSRRWRCTRRACPNVRIAIGVGDRGGDVIGPHRPQPYLWAHPIVVRREPPKRQPAAPPPQAVEPNWSDAPYPPGRPAAPRTATNVRAHRSTRCRRRSGVGRGRHHRRRPCLGRAGVIHAGRGGIHGSTPAVALHPTRARRADRPAAPSRDRATSGPTPRGGGGDRVKPGMDMLTGPGRLDGCAEPAVQRGGLRRGISTLATRLTGKNR